MPYGPHAHDTKPEERASISRCLAPGAPSSTLGLAYLPSGQEVTTGRASGYAQVNYSPALDEMDPRERARKKTAGRVGLEAIRLG
jgi:hypothetical protein